MFVIDPESAQHSLELYQNSERSCLVLRHSSGRVLYQDHQLQGWNWKIRESTNETKNMTNEEKQTRSWSVEGNFLQQARKARTHEHETAGRKPQASQRFWKKTKVAVHHKQQKRHHILQVRENARWVYTTTREECPNNYWQRFLRWYRPSHSFISSNKRNVICMTNAVATTGNHWRGCVRKVSPIQKTPNGAIIYYDGQSCFLYTTDVRTRAQLGNVMTESLGEDTSYNQPLKLRDEIHTGKLKIRPAHGQALPLN